MSQSWGAVRQISSDIYLPIFDITDGVMIRYVRSSVYKLLTIHGPSIFDINDQSSAILYHVLEEIETLVEPT